MRYFSPLDDVAFCGHATVAAAVAIAERRSAGQFGFETLAGRIEIDTVESDAGLAAALTSVPTPTRPATADEADEALRALRWTADDLDKPYAPHVAFAGNDHLVVALRSRERLAA